MHVAEMSAKLLTYLLMTLTLVHAQVERGVITSAMSATGVPGERIKLTVSYPGDTRPQSQRYAKLDLSIAFNATTIQILDVEKNDVVAYVPAGRWTSYFDATDLEVTLPLDLVTGKKYVLKGDTGCSFDATTFSVCKLAMDCRPCAGDFNRAEFESSPFTVIAQKADSAKTDKAYAIMIYLTALEATVMLKQ